MKKTFALYRGDQFIDLGTRQELAKKMGVTPKTISYLSTPARMRKIKGKENKSLIAIKIEDDEDE